MKIRIIFFCSIFFMMFFSSFAQAGSHVLTVRQLPNDEYEAVITYDRWECRSDVNPAASIQYVDSNVYIESPPLGPVGCITPLPAEYIEATTNIGYLASGNYIVYWEQPGTFSLSTRLSAGGYSPIPSSSFWSLLLLALGVLVVVHFTLRSRRYTAPK